jgi:hypothetical protein
MDARFGLFGGPWVLAMGMEKRNTNDSNNTMTSGQYRSLRPVIYTKLVENVDHMALDGMGTDCKLIRDFHICGPLGNEPKHLLFSFSQRQRQANIFTLINGFGRTIPCFKRSLPITNGLLPSPGIRSVRITLKVYGDCRQQVPFAIQDRIDGVQSQGSSKTGTAVRSGLASTQSCSKGHTGKKSAFAAVGARQEPEDIQHGKGSVAFVIWLDGVLAEIEAVKKRDQLFHKALGLLAIRKGSREPRAPAKGATETVEGELDERGIVTVDGFRADCIDVGSEQRGIGVKPEISNDYGHPSLLLSE